MKLTPTEIQDIADRYACSIDPDGAVAEALQQCAELATVERVIDPKHLFRGGSIVKRSTGEPIPDDEPLMLFRARDYLARPMLEHYKKLAIADACTEFHIDGIDNRIEAFEKFATDHPERMKQPGCTKGQ